MNTELNQQRYHCATSEDPVMTSAAEQSAMPSDFDAFLTLQQQTILQQRLLEEKNRRTQFSCGGGGEERSAATMTKKMEAPPPNNDENLDSHQQQQQPPNCTTREEQLAAWKALKKQHGPSHAALKSSLHNSGSTPGSCSMSREAASLTTTTTRSLFGTTQSRRQRRRFSGSNVTTASPNQQQQQHQQRHLTATRRVPATTSSNNRGRLSTSTRDTTTTSTTHTTSGIQRLQKTSSTTANHHRSSITSTSISTAVLLTSERPRTRSLPSTSRILKNHQPPVIVRQRFLSPGKNASTRPPIAKSPRCSVCTPPKRNAPLLMSSSEPAVAGMANHPLIPQNVAATMAGQLCAAAQKQRAGHQPRHSSGSLLLRVAATTTTAKTKSSITNDSQQRAVPLPGTTITTTAASKNPMERLSVAATVQRAKERASLSTLTPSKVIPLVTYSVHPNATSDDSSMLNYGNSPLTCSITSSGCSSRRRLDAEFGDEDERDDTLVAAAATTSAANVADSGSKNCDDGFDDAPPPPPLLSPLMAAAAAAPKDLDEHTLLLVADPDNETSLHHKLGRRTSSSSPLETVLLPPSLDDLSQTSTIYFSTTTATTELLLLQTPNEDVELRFLFQPLAAAAVDAADFDDEVELVALLAAEKDGEGADELVAAAIFMEQKQETQGDDELAAPEQYEELVEAAAIDVSAGPAPHSAVVLLLQRDTTYDDDTVSATPRFDAAESLPEEATFNNRIAPDDARMLQFETVDRCRNEDLVPAVDGDFLIAFETAGVCPENASAKLQLEESLSADPYTESTDEELEDIAARTENCSRAISVLKNGTLLSVLSGSDDEITERDGDELASEQFPQQQAHELDGNGNNADALLSKDELLRGGASEDAPFKCCFADKTEELAELVHFQAAELFLDGTSNTQVPESSNAGVEGTVDSNDVIPYDAESQVLVAAETETVQVVDPERLENAPGDETFKVTDGVCGRDTFVEEEKMEGDECELVRNCSAAVLTRSPTASCSTTTDVNSVRIAEHECPEPLLSAVAAYSERLNSEEVDGAMDAVPYKCPLPARCEQYGAPLISCTPSEPLDTGSFEEDALHIYRSIQEAESSDEEAKRYLSIEEECPLLQSAIEAFDWRKELQSPTEMPLRRRTDVSKLFLPDPSLRKAHDSPGEAWPVQLATPTLTTPTGDEQAASVDENDTFDWRKEIQSPALRPRSKRRIDAAILPGSLVTKEVLRSSTRPSSADDEEDLASSYETNGLLLRRQQDEVPRYEASIDETNGLLLPQPQDKLPRYEDFENEQYELHSRKSNAAVSPRSEGKGDDSDSPCEAVTNSDASDAFPLAMQRRLRSRFRCAEQATSEIETDSTCLALPDNSDEVSFEFSGLAEGEMDGISDTAHAIGFVRVDGKTLLSSVREDTTSSELVDVEVHRRLMIENQKLKDQLRSMRSDYDDRVTPFRDLFDERRKLMVENLRFALEKKEIQEKLVVVQKKTMTAVTVAIEKTKFLQGKLNEAKRENGNLTAALAEAASEIALLKSTLKSQL